MSDEEEVEAPAPAGMPGWVMTFADLMSLLMCFFVLLLSFSQMDNAKFKKVAGSMEKAFGVQRDIVAYEIPKGTSIIAKEFSPGKPQPTPLRQIRQMTIDDMKQTLDFDEMRSDGENKQQEEFEGSSDNQQESNELNRYKNPDEKTQQAAQDIAEALAKEIVAGILEVEASEQRVVIRILEQGSFSSGEDILRASFMPVLKKIRTVLKAIPGKITVAGHTDDIPIYTNRFRSNWELSAARAISVAHEILRDEQIDKSRITVSGYADTQPLFANDSEAHRQQNRRVEIILQQGDKPRYKKVSEEAVRAVPEEPVAPANAPVSGQDQSDYSLIDSLFKDKE